ncbi:MAG: iron-sulfur cluster repair di-iron protein [Kiritimatiellia bacterium]
MKNNSDSNANFHVLKTPNPSEMSSGGITVRQDQTVAELVIGHPELREKLEKMGIDYCCGGKRPLGEAVGAAGIEWPAFVSKLQGEAKPSAQKDWSKAPVTELADHILDKHHAFMKEQLPRMDSLLAKVRSAHGENHGAMIDDLRRVFNSLRSEIEMHLMKEEQILFPAIKAVDAYVSGTGGLPVIHCGSVANPIRQMEHEHDSAGEALAEMRRITGNYTLPEDACQSFAALYDGLQAIEADLHEHIHLENNILFPRSIRQEEEMRKQ